MRKFAIAVFITGLFVLMLSALVVTPEAVAAPVTVRPAEEQHAVFLPPADAYMPSPSEMPRPRCDMESSCTADPIVVQTGWNVQGMRDSNGRVLCALRYEDCVYQVFRPETAGG